MDSDYKIFNRIVNSRRSVRKYDSTKTIDSEIVQHCLEHATNAPNSSNMQLWQFYHITSPEIIKKIAKFCFDQSAAKTAQQLVVVVVRKDLWKKRVKSNLIHLTKAYGDKPPSQRTKREKFAFSYYSKLMPFTYFDILGLFGWVKYLFFWMVGLFRPIYRQVRNSDMRIVAHKSAGLAAQTFMLGMASHAYDTCPMEGIDSLRIKKELGLPLRSEINMVISCGIRVPEGIYGERFRIPFNEVYKRL